MAPETVDKRPPDDDEGCPFDPAGKLIFTDIRERVSTGEVNTRFTVSWPEGRLAARSNGLSECQNL